MAIDHLGPWIGAIAGLRVVVAAYALAAAWRFRENLRRTIRDRFDARPGDALCAFVALVSIGVFGVGVYGLTFVLSVGHAPGDVKPWSRATAALSYSTLCLAYMFLITGVTTRAAGRGEGVKAFRRTALIAATMMAIGAFL